FPGEQLDEFLARAGARRGDAVLFTSGPWEPTLKALGVLRTRLGQPLLHGERFYGLEPVDTTNRWALLWVRQFPLFEWYPDRERRVPDGWEPLGGRPRDAGGAEDQGGGVGSSTRGRHGERAGSRTKRVSTLRPPARPRPSRGAA